MKTNRIFFAIGHRQVEEFIKKSLQNDFEFVGETVYREGIIKGIDENQSDILILRESLNGSQDILDIVYELKRKYPLLRIIFIAKSNRVAGDKLLSALVGYGVYDILTGLKVNVKEIINLIKNPNTISEAMEFQPKIKVNEKDNTVLFDAPTHIVKKVEVVKYIDNVKMEENEKEEKHKNNKEIIIDDIDNVDFVPIKNNEEIDKKKVQVKEKQEEKTENIKNSIEINSFEDINIEKVDDLIVASKKDVQELEKKKAIIKEKEKKIKALQKNIEEHENKVIEPKVNTVYKDKQKIISFIGGRFGTGNTQIAFNTAILLSNLGHKVMYIEMSQIKSQIGYIYQLNLEKKGLDTALKGILEDNYAEIDNSIIHMKNIKNTVSKENYLYDNYKKFPDNIDFLLLSENYNSNDYDCYNKDALKELYLNLLYQKSYDIIILDLTTDNYTEALETSIFYSNKVFFTISQDINVISSCIYKINEIHKRRINLGEKLYYILNKYDEKAKLSKNDISSWLGENIPCNIVTTIPNQNRLFIDSNYIGLPIILNSPNRHIRQAFSDIINNINN